MFNKQKDEIKTTVKEEVSEIVNSGKVLSIGIMILCSLTVGYILGSVTTGAMDRALLAANR